MKKIYNDNIMQLKDKWNFLPCNGTNCKEGEQMECISKKLISSFSFVINALSLFLLPNGACVHLFFWYWYKH